MISRRSLCDCCAAMGPRQPRPFGVNFAIAPFVGFRSASAVPRSVDGEKVSPTDSCSAAKILRLLLTHGCVILLAETNKQPSAASAAKVGIRCTMEQVAPIGLHPTGLVSRECSRATQDRSVNLTPHKMAGKVIAHYKILASRLWGGRTPAKLSRIGQSGISPPRHCAAMALRTRSRPLRSFTFRWMSAMWCSVMLFTLAHVMRRPPGRPRSTRIWSREKPSSRALPDEDQALLVFGCVEPVSASATRRLRQDPNAFVVADGVDSDLGSFRKRSDRQLRICLQLWRGGVFEGQV
jgi:hypothetical protein